MARGGKLGSGVEMIEQSDHLVKLPMVLHSNGCMS